MCGSKEQGALALIRKLEPHELSGAFEVIKQAIVHMRKNGIDQWDDLYPAENDIREDIDSGQAFGLFAGTTLAGYIALNEQESPEYNDVQWKHSDAKRLIIHRLCIHPGFQRKGYSTQLLKFAERYGSERGYILIRLDAFLQNRVALHLYETNDYILCGNVTFRKGIFNCYEKRLRLL